MWIETSFSSLDYFRIKILCRPLKNLPRNDSIEHSSKDVQVDSEEDVGKQEIWDSSEDDLYVAFESSEVEEEESECADVKLQAWFDW